MGQGQLAVDKVEEGIVEALKTARHRQDAEHGLGCP